MRLSPGSFNPRNSEVWWNCLRSAVSIIDTSGERHSHSVLFGRSLTLHLASTAAPGCDLWIAPGLDPEGGLGSRGLSLVGAASSAAAGVAALDSAPLPLPGGDRAAVAADQSPQHRPPAAGGEA